MKDRVHELAKEFGVTSQDVLASLSELGEFVKSASSTIEAPVARRLRQHYGSREANPPQIPPSCTQPTLRNADGPPRTRAANNPFAAPRPRPLSPRPRWPGPHEVTDFKPLPTPRAKKPRRRWYEGPELPDLVIAIIRRGLVADLDYTGKEPPRGRYFADEVTKAKAIHDEWAEAAFDLLLEGTPEYVVDWIGADSVRLEPEEALAFHNAAVRPAELEWVEADSWGTFRARYWFGELTMTEVVEKVQSARQANRTSAK